MTIQFRKRVVGFVFFGFGVAVACRNERVLRCGEASCAMVNAVVAAPGGNSLC